MTPGYLIEFAVRDLTAPTARRATLVVLAAVAAAAAFAVAGFGFTAGVTRAETNRVLRDPLALCVFAGDRSIGFGGYLREEDVPAAAARVRAAVGDPALIRGVYPIRQVELTFANADGDYVGLPGRTIALGPDSDPLPESRPVDGEWLAGPADGGIVLTPSALRGLKFAARPPEVTVVYRGTPVRLPVRGVTQTDLPNPAHRFVVPEALLATIAAAPNPDLRGNSALSGPVPREWMTPDERWMVKPVAAAAAAAFAAPDFEFSLKPEGQTLLAAEIDPLKRAAADRRRLARSEWRAKFEKVQAAAAAAGLPTPADFLAGVRVDGVAPPTDAPAQEEVSGPPTYNLLAVYTTGRRALRPTADALEAYRMANGQPLKVDRGVIEQLDRIGEQSERYEKAMTTVAVAMAVIFAVMVWFVFLVRSELQIAEIGMLKAMGMTQLGRLAALQGAMVGAVGGLLGAAGGAAALAVLAALFYRGDPTAAADARTVGVRLVFAVWAVATVGCAGVAWVATRPARRMSAAEAMRTAA